MKISIHGKNINLTQEVKDYVEAKVGSLTKFYDKIQDAKVELGRESRNPKKGKDAFFVHVTLSVPNKVLRVEEHEPKLRKAIDKAKDDLQRELKVYKRKSQQKDKESIKMIEPEDLGLDFPRREEE